MSRTPRSRRLAAVLALLLIGSLFPAASAAASAGDASGGGTPAATGWWTEWLEAFDLNANRIDDEAESIARRALLKGNPDALVPVLVTFDGGLPADRKGFLEYVGAAPHAFFFKTQPVVDLDVPASHLGRLSRIQGVVVVEHDRKMRPVLNVSGPATQAHNGTGANNFYNGRTAEDLGYTGQDMVVAVLDTGVQDQHAAFAGKWIAGAHVGLPVPVNCVNPVDDDGHGTHVASTVLGQMASNNLYGTAKAAKLVEVKISAGPVSLGGIARGFEFVRRYNEALAAGTPMCGPNDDHIDVATLSFGSTGRGGSNAGTDEPFIDALAKSGVAVTIAVGNCGPQPSATCSFGDTDNGISSPGNAAGAIGVGSFDDKATVDRSNDIISGFSSRGPNNQSGDTAAGGATSAANLADRYRRPEIAAPGQSIQAAGVAPFTLNTLSGTSMATPHVAGIAALLLEAGEKAKAETGGVNLMASTGNGYSATGSYVRGVYPVRDAIIHSPEYKVAGAESKWTGPNSAGLTWNNAWGYGQVNAFGAVCWAWANVLAPGGATPPAPVSDRCDLTTIDPEPTETPTSDPTPTPTESATSEPTPAGPATTYYLHSLTGDNTLDQPLDGATFDKAAPTFAPGEHSIARDLPGAQNAGAIEVVDPTWRGSLDAPAGSLSVDFWGEQIPDQDLGSINYTVRVLPQGSTSYYELLPAISRAETKLGAVNIKHTFTSMKLGTAGAVEPLNLPAGPLTFTLRGTYFVDDALTTILFDSTEYNSSFSVQGAGGAEPTESASATPTASESPTPPPPSGRGTYPASPNDPLFADQWGMAKISAPQAWQEQNATGFGINIAIVDSGVDLGHEDFACPGKLSVLPGSDISVDDHPQDEDGHGTHVAGIAAACTNNDTGVVGVAPDATLLPVRVFGESDLDKSMADGIRFATNNGAHVINLSIGDIPPFSHLGPDGYPLTEEAMEFARSEGVVIAAAAGNFVQPTCEYPSLSRNVICVVATDRDDMRTWYTDFPVNIDRNSDEVKMEPVVAAPGGQGTFCEEGVTSTYLRSEPSNCHTAGYEVLDGTSMAAPHVAGLAALLYDRVGGERSKANADTIVQTILDTSDDLYSPGWDPIVGYGRVNALSAVQALEVEPEPEVTSVSFTDDSSQQGQYSDDATFRARLSDESGAAIEGAELAFEAAGAGETLKWTAVTGNDGVATASKELDLAPGEYQLTVHYSGAEDEYQASSDDGGVLVVSQEDTAAGLEAGSPEGRGKNASRTLTATLSDPDGSSNVAGRVVDFYSDGELMGSAATNDQGVAVFKTPHNYTNGHRVYEAVFQGDAYYLGSSASQSG